MRRNDVGLAAVVGFVALLLGPAPVLAQSAPTLGTAQAFSVLGGSTVTNTGATVVTGDLGVSPGAAITGFPPGIVIGTIHAADATAAQAQVDLTTAYNAVASQACTVDLTGQDLGGMTLLPGVYCFATSAQLTGTLRLNALGNPNAVFLFKIGSTLTTASGSTVTVINGAVTCTSSGMVFWQVGSSATLGTSTTFAGNMLALASITLNTGATVKGRVLARTGAVTLDTNTIDRTAAGCVLCPTVTLSPPALPNGTVGSAYNQTIVGSGGQAPYTFARTAGTLPAGLTLTAAGVLSGTPTTASAYSFTIRGTDANGCFAEALYSILVSSAVPTLSGRGMITLAALLALAGFIAAVRRRQKWGRD